MRPEETTSLPKDHRPLIVTARMCEPAQAFLDELRTRHFPAGRNFLRAHVTLFHALPGEQRQIIGAALAEEADGCTPLVLVVSALRMTGNGVAYALDGKGLAALHARLVRRFEPWLTRQDRQGFRPHVTVQNKVTPDVARALHAELSRRFSPWPLSVTGIDLWHYDDGPWAPAAHFDFKEA